MITVHDSIEPENPLKPLVIIEFPKPGNAPALELHVWRFRGKCQIEWITEDGASLGLKMGEEC